MIELYGQIYAYLLDPARLPIAVLALALVAVTGVITGPFRGNANPWLWWLTDSFFGGLGNRLDRPERRAGDLITRGFILTVAVLCFAGALGKAAQMLALNKPFYDISEIVLLSLTLAGGAVWYALLKLFFALKENKVGHGAYYIIARSARIDLSGADNFTITRAGMGYAARSFDKGLVAPVIWYLIAGLPGAYIYACLAALAVRFGRDGFTAGLGRMPLALEWLMGVVPGMVSGVLMALGGLFTPTGGMTRAFRGLMSGKGRAPYAEGGWPVTAMAHSLDVALGGPVTDLDGRSLKRHWAGPENATARLEEVHLKRAIYIVLMAYLLFMASLIGAMIWSEMLFPGL